MAIPICVIPGLTRDSAFFVEGREKKGAGFRIKSGMTMWV
jgi:hypothetical protein